MAKFTMELVKTAIIPRLATGLMTELVEKKLVEINRDELVKMDALIIDEEHHSLLAVVYAAMGDGWTDVTKYFEAVHEKGSPEFYSVESKCKAGTEYYLRNLPLFKVQLVEFQKKSLFKPEIFKAKLVRSEMLNDICQCMDKIAVEAGTKLYFGYVYGRNGTLTIRKENHIFSREELKQIEEYHSPFFNGRGGFIVSLGTPISDSEINV